MSLLYRENGIIMKNGDYILVIAPLDYKGKRYRGRYCYEHHLVWWRNTGMVLNENEVIHHKDGNKRNNSFDNLIVLSKKDHVSGHRKSIGKSFVTLICPNCKKEFTRKRGNTFLVKSRNATFCSRECSGKFNHKVNKASKISQHDLIVSEFKKHD
jgi:hypothetical protein